ncbi:AI-2E family transporter [Candidatus Woesearchaeota archaeon]|nr:MAG: AI-2E family transporter [Candidatus Woesearchaeota archaeon]
MISKGHHRLNSTNSYSQSKTFYIKKQPAIEVKRGFDKLLASIVIVVLALFLAYALTPYITAFFTAIIFFTLFNSTHSLLSRYFGKQIAAGLVIVLTILIAVLPLILLIPAMLGQVGPVASQASELISMIPDPDTSIPSNIRDFLSSQISSAATFLRGLLISAIQSLGSATVSLIITYFTLYYLLTNKERAGEITLKIIPFKKESAIRLIEEFKRVTYSTIVATGVVALVQSAIFTATLFLLRIDGALIWGLLALIASFIPVAGIPFVWIPAMILQFAQGNMIAAICILIVGLILSNVVDNLLRPFIQKRIGALHPLTSLLGLIIGLPFFGMAGVVVGPLLISYFLLLVRMYREEYF